MQRATPTQPVRVYLDNSDWSLITDAAAGKRPQDEPAIASLREFGASGRATFLLSREHIEEFSGLTKGLNARLECVHRFPGTFLLTESATVVLQRAVANMVAELSGREPEPIHLQQQAFAQLSIEELTAQVHANAVVRTKREHWANAMQLSRSAAQASSNPERDRRIVGLMRAGNASAVLRLLHPNGVNSEAERNRIRKLTRVAYAEWKKAAEAKQTSPLEVPYDPSFDRWVFWRVPSEHQSDVPLLKRLQVSWARRRPPALACEAAVLESVDSNLEQKYTSTASEELDAAHSAFAPFVEVFTADKRVEPALQRLKLPTKIARSGRLDDVAAKVQALLAAQY